MRFKMVSTGLCALGIDSPVLGPRQKKALDRFCSLGDLIWASSVRSWFTGVVILTHQDKAPWLSLIPKEQIQIHPVSKAVLGISQSIVLDTLMPFLIEQMQLPGICLPALPTIRQWWKDPELGPRLHEAGIDCCYTVVRWRQGEAQGTTTTSLSMSHGFLQRTDLNPQVIASHRGIILKWGTKIGQGDSSF